MDGILFIFFLDIALKKRKNRLFFYEGLVNKVTDRFDADFDLRIDRFP